MRVAAMAPGDLALALDWAAAEGWNPGLDDAAAFMAADPGGFLMGWVGEVPVAAISVVRHSDAFGFLGLYICRQGWRGRGHGMALWQAGLAHLGGRVVGLDGVVAQQANYARSGFAPSHRTIRFHGDIAPATAPEVGAMRPGLLAQILALDAAAGGVARPAYLGAWLADTATRRTLVLEREGRVLGYGTIRTCRSGSKIGPLHAADAEAAGRLIGALACHAAPAGGIFLDVPEPNGAAVALARARGMQPVFETARMFRGPAPARRHDHIFGEVTLELG